MFNYDSVGCFHVCIPLSGPNIEHSPTLPDQERCGSYSVPFASAWRERGVVVESKGDSTTAPRSHDGGANFLASCSSVTRHRSCRCST